MFDILPTIMLSGSLPAQAMLVIILALCMGALGVIAVYIIEKLIHWYEG